ncbi:hypothetical protein K435DRAFT_960987 [Dendrothele bispora CBS 962.96]|uniref:Uncharacterized protein n=1 Tax=Dendrothele bispora (strain CBS 962.96) TaxID=1314807 RepID=A0A4S8MTL2_DENBC|nr:hypothetical protein K435DRAFT_960987 [Dendrothele bispora CBS 962.96]
MINVKSDSLLLDAFALGPMAGRKLQLIPSRAPASARADKIFNDPDSWGSDGSVEDLRSSPPFYDDDIYSGTVKDNEVKNGYSSNLMVSKSGNKSAVNRLTTHSQNELTIKPFENKFHLQKRPSISSDSDTSSSAFTSSAVSSATSFMNDIEPESVSLVKPRWESVRDEVAEESQAVSLSPILEKSPKLKLDSISGRMSFFWQHQNIFRALQTPKSSDFDFANDDILTPFTPNSDFWKGKKVLENFEKSMEKDDFELPLTRVGPKHKRTRTPPSIGPLTISTTTMTTTTTTTTVVTVHSPALATPASVTTIISASTTWSILDLYGASPTSPQRGRLPLVPKTSGPMVTTFTPPSPSQKFARRSSLPKSALVGTTFGFVEDFLRVPGETPFSSPKIVELPDDFAVPAQGQPRIKAASETTVIPAPRAPLTVPIPDPKMTQKPKSKKVVRPLPRLPRASSPPPPVPALPNVLPVLPPIPKHSPLPLPVTPSIPSGSSVSSASSSSSSSLKSSPEVPSKQPISASTSFAKPTASRIPHLKKPSDASSSSTPPLPHTTPGSSVDTPGISPLPPSSSAADADMKSMKNFLRSQSYSDLKTVTRPLTPSGSKVAKSSSSKTSPVPPIPALPPLELRPSTPLAPPSKKDTPPVPVPPVPSLDIHADSTPAVPSIPVVGTSETISSDKVRDVRTSPKNRPPELQPSSYTLTPPSSSTLSSAALSSASSTSSGIRRMRSPSVSAADVRRTSDHSSSTLRNPSSTKSKRQTSLQIPIANVPFPDATILALRRNRSGSVSASTNPSISPVPTATGQPGRKPSISLSRPNVTGVIGRARSGSESVSSSVTNDGSPVVLSSDLEASASSVSLSNPLLSLRTQKISSTTSSQPLTQTSITPVVNPLKSDVEVSKPMRKSPPLSSTLQLPELGKGVLGSTAGKTHSRSPSTTAPPSIPIPPIPVAASSSSVVKTAQNGDSRSQNPVLTVPDISVPVVTLSRSPSKKRDLSSLPVPQMDIPFPDAATLARRVTKKTSVSHPKQPQVNEPMPDALTFPGRKQVTKNVSLTNSDAAPLRPEKSLKRVSSTPAFRSNGGDLPLPNPSLLAKRMVPTGVVPDVPAPPKMPVSSTKVETKNVVPSTSSPRPKAPPLPDIFFKPGTGSESKGKEKEKSQEIIEGGKVSKQGPKKDKGKQKEVSPPLPSLPSLPPVNVDVRFSTVFDKEFEKELDKAVSIRSTASSSTATSSSSSSSSKSVSDSNKKASSRPPKPPVPPLPDIFFKKTEPKEQESKIPVPAKSNAVSTTVSVQPVTSSTASSSKPVSESTRKRLSTVAPIVTDFKRPAPPVHAHTIPASATPSSKHSRSRSMSSTRVPVPRVVPIAPPVPSLPQQIPDESVQYRRDEEDDTQVIVVRSRRTRSPTRAMTPGGPRSRSVATSSRVPYKPGPSSSAASVMSYQSDSPLMPPPPLMATRDESRSSSPVTPGSRGRVSPFPVVPRSARMSIATAA